MAKYKRNSDALFGCGWILITAGIVCLFVHFCCPQLFVALSMIRDKGNYLIEYVALYGVFIGIILLGGIITLLSFWAKKKEKPGDPIPFYFKEWKEMTSDEKYKFLKYVFYFLGLEIIVIALFFLFR